MPPQPGVVVSTLARWRSLLDLRKVSHRRAATRPATLTLRGVRGGTAVPGEREHPGSGVRCGVRCGVEGGSRGHGTILLEQVFEARVQSVDI